MKPTPKKTTKVTSTILNWNNPKSKNDLTTFIWI